MKKSTIKSRPHEPAIFYYWMEDIETVLKCTIGQNVTLLIIDGTSSSACKPSVGTYLSANVDTHDGYECALLALKERLYDAIVFVCDTDRDLDFLQMSPGEVAFCKEWAFLRIAEKGNIITYPLHRRFPPASNQNCDQSWLTAAN